MGLRTEVAADHDDWREPEPAARYRNGVELALEDIAEARERQCRLPADHPAQGRIAHRIEEATRRLEFNAARLREMEGHQHAA